MPWVSLFMGGVFDYKKKSTVVKIICVKTTANVRGYLVLVSVKDHKCGIIRGILAAATLAIATSRSY